MVKPAGTGRPMLVISARLAPLPPRRFFMSALPSALPPPKKYTYFGMVHILFNVGESRPPGICVLPCNLEIVRGGVQRNAIGTRKSIRRPNVLGLVKRSKVMKTALATLAAVVLLGAMA